MLGVEGVEGMQVENTFWGPVPHSKLFHKTPDRKYSYISVITGGDSNRPLFPALQCSIHVLHFATVTFSLEMTAFQFWVKWQLNIMEHKSICRHVLQGPLEGKVRKYAYICTPSVVRVNLQRCSQHPSESPGCEKATRRGKRKSCFFCMSLQQEAFH